MHNKEELDLAVLKLYNDYREVMKKYKNGDKKIIYDLLKINNDEKEYTKEEAYYIGFSALAMLTDDMNKEKYKN